MAIKNDIFNACIDLLLPLLHRQTPRERKHKQTKEKKKRKQKREIKLENNVGRKGKTSVTM